MHVSVLQKVVKFSALTLQTLPMGEINRIITLGKKKDSPNEDAFSDELLEGMDNPPKDWPDLWKRAFEKVGADLVIGRTALQRLENIKTADRRSKRKHLAQRFESDLETFRERIGGFVTGFGESAPEWGPLPDQSVVFKFGGPSDVKTVQDLSARVKDLEKISGLLNRLFPEEPDLEVIDTGKGSWEAFLTSPLQVLFAFKTIVLLAVTVKLSWAKAKKLSAQAERELAEAENLNKPEEDLDVLREYIETTMRLYELRKARITKQARRLIGRQLEGLSDDEMNERMNAVESLFTKIAGMVGDGVEILTNLPADQETAADLQELAPEVWKDSAELAEMYSELGNELREAKKLTTDIDEEES